MSHVARNILASLLVGCLLRRRGGLGARVDDNTGARVSVDSDALVALRRGRGRVRRFRARASGRPEKPESESCQNHCQNTTHTRNHRAEIPMLRGHELQSSCR